MNFSELSIYALGLACIARSIMAFTNPQAEYALNGLRHTATSKDDPSSEPIYMLGTWELSVGILLLAHQMNGNSNGVTTLLGLMSLYKAGIAILLWKIGSGTNKVAGNVATTAFLLTWAASRR
ncbi:Sorbose reductase SOU1 [Fusarium tjaetaba]|uniref:Sorbose reductase SOU1 n=1 Tax=Fusarium tjaetaba TaxID=1567544 RepID=A0A8H5VJI1_9HYPO|nr:Sorbose reductase SOU1 [Fusarium tjaetaba]KAF5623299.1 Sorbose reductase SOU1 [Fusarium tjaetaba]